MKVKVLLISFLFVAAAAASAADNWLTSYPDALAQAKSQNKPILMDFTGSDWCPWCMKLDKEVFATPAFQSFATAHLILLKVDFPRKTALPANIRQQNDELEKKFAVDGFPTLILLNSNGVKIGTGGYQEGGPQPTIAWIRNTMLHPSAQ